MININNCTIAQLDTISHGKIPVIQDKRSIKFSDESSKLIYRVNISDNNIEVEYSDNEYS